MAEAKRCVNCGAWLNLDGGFGKCEYCRTQYGEIPQYPRGILILSGVGEEEAAYAFEAFRQAPQRPGDIPVLRLPYGTAEYVRL